jgi:SAM-dependent methyltransferase
MTRIPIDVYSQEYKTLLAIDNETHRIRTTEKLGENLEWTYDPVGSSWPYSWIYEAILGAEFVRWEQCMRRKFGRAARIIDLGCGPGGSSLWFAARGHDVIGIDACKERIEVASQVAERYKQRIENAGGRLRFVHSDLFEYDPLDHDAVISVKTFHHIPDIEALLRRYAINMNPRGTFFVLDQVGSGSFSHLAYRLGRAIYPPGMCITSWYRRQRAAAGATLRMLRIMKQEDHLSVAVSDPLEGIGQNLTIPTFLRLFRKVSIRNVDPLRVLFIAIDLKEQFCKRWILSPFLALNQLFRLSGPSFEKGIIAHREDMR